MSNVIQMDGDIWPGYIFALFVNDAVSIRALPRKMKAFGNDGLRALLR